MIATAKTPTNKLEANAKYDAKTYKEINIKLRIEEDADIIESLEQAKRDNVHYRDWLRKYFEGN